MAFLIFIIGVAQLLLGTNLLKSGDFYVKTKGFGGLALGTIFTLIGIILIIVNHIIPALK
jgi:hypothetical protein